MYAASTPERPLGELFSELARETGTLVRNEVQLAKTELTETARDAGKHVGVVAAGGVLSHAALLFVLAAVSLLLGHVMPLWIATLLVGVIAGVSGYLMIQKGTKALRSVRGPERTVRTLKDNALWVREQIQ
jgi:hypothetical protein